MAEQSIDGVLCVGTIDENTSHIDHYERRLGSGRREEPENFLELGWSCPMATIHGKGGEPLTFEWLVSVLKADQTNYEKLVAVQKTKE